MLWTRTTTICARRLGQERCDEFRRRRGLGARREPSDSTFTRGGAHMVTVSGARLLVIRQQLSRGWEMPCSLHDVLRMLTFVPRAMWSPLRILIFRQPTRREDPFDACVCWGFRARGVVGNAIAINAVNERRGCGARDATRAYVLYRVLLHEIGHLVVGSDEEGAERFALDWERRLHAARVIPFAPQPDEWDAPTRRHGWRERIARRDQAALAAQ